MTPLPSLEPLRQELPLTLILSVQRTPPETTPATPAPDLTDQPASPPVLRPATRPALMIHFEGYSHGGLND